MHTPRAQPRRHTIGPVGHLGERPAPLRTVLFDDPQCRCVVSAGDRVEVVERPVELGQLRPPEPGVRGLVVVGVRQQEVTRGVERRHILVSHGKPPRPTYRRLILKRILPINVRRP
jgi:hypothetical protein